MCFCMHEVLFPNYINYERHHDEFVQKNELTSNSLIPNGTQHELL